MTTEHTTERDRDVLVAEGVVASQLRGDIHEVDVIIGDSTRRILARRAGRLICGRIKCLAGDRVEVEISPYDLSRGRIVRRGDR